MYTVWAFILNVHRTKKGFKKQGFYLGYTADQMYTIGLVMPAEVRFLHLLVETLAFRCGILQYLAWSKKLHVSGGVWWCTYIHRDPPIAGGSGVIGNKTKMVNAA